MYATTTTLKELNKSFKKFMKENEGRKLLVVVSSFGKRMFSNGPFGYLWAFFFRLLLFESELPAGHVQTDDDDGDD